MAGECMAAKCMAAATRPLVVNDQEYTPSMARFNDLLRRIAECKVTQDFLTAEQTQSLGLVVENLDSWPSDASPYFAPATEAELLAGIRAVSREEDKFYAAWTKRNRQISADARRDASDWAKFLTAKFSEQSSTYFDGKPRSYDVYTDGTTLRSATRWNALFDGFGDDRWDEPLIQSYPPAQEGEPEKWKLVSHFAAERQHGLTYVGPPHLWAMLAYDIPFDDRVSFGELCCVVTIIRDRLLGTDLWPERGTHFPILLFVNNTDSVRMIQACWDHQRLHLRRTLGIRLANMSHSDFSEHNTLLRWMMAMPVHPLDPAASPVTAATTALIENDEEVDTPSMLHFDDLTRRWNELDPSKANFLTEQEQEYLDLVVGNLDCWPTTASPHFGLATEAELLNAMRDVCPEDQFFAAWMEWNGEISANSERHTSSWATFLDTMFSKESSTGFTGEPYDVMTGGITLQSATSWGALFDGFGDDYWAMPLVQCYPPAREGEPEKWELVSHFCAKKDRSSGHVGMPHVLAIVAYNVAFDGRVSFGELSCVTTIMREKIAARELWPSADCNLPVLLFMTNRTGVRMVQAFWDDFRLHLVRTPEMRLEHMTASDCADHKLLLRWMMAAPLDPAAGR